MIKIIQLLDSIAKGDTLLVNHEAKDTQHDSAAVVEINSMLVEICLLAIAVPVEADVFLS